MAEPACPRHRTLVDAALGDAPDDETLERYAAEVATCPDCRRALSVQLRVHPAVLERGGADNRDLRGMRELWGRLAEPVSPGRVRWLQGAAVAVALAAAAVVLAPLLERDTPTIAPAAPAPEVAAPKLEPVPEPPAPPAEPVLRPVEIVEVAPRPQSEPAPSPAELAPPPEQDAVALADDWPAPPFEELRDGTSKALGGIRSVQLVLSSPGPRRVGDTVGLTVVASQATALAVCVTGPERGVVWRGGVSAGRIDLTRGGRRQSFTLGAPGTYRFAVSTDDTERCVDPVHIVEVEVGS